LNAAGTSRAAAAALSLDVLVLAGTALVVALALGIAGPDTPAATRLLLAVAAPVLLVPLFSGEVARTSTALAASIGGWFCSTLLLVVIAIVYGARPATAQLVPLLLVALGVVVVTQLAARAATRLLQTAGLDEPAAREWARWLAAAILWLLATAPLWLGPLAALGADAGPERSSAIVAASPLVHLGVAAGQDLLRTQWWYAHTSFGSLQFDYPALSTIALACAAMVLALAALDFVLSRRDASPRPSLPEPLPTQEPAR
jgi:hypothetical protein